MKLSTQLVVIITAAITSSTAFSQTYSTTGSTAGISVSALSATAVYYTAATNGSSDTNYPGVTYNFTGDWSFTFNSDNSVDFSGNMDLGDYETQTNVTGFPTIDGHQQFYGVTQAVAGTGSYDPATHTFSYFLQSGGSNSSIASTQTQASSSCQNGRTSVFGNVCDTWAGTTAAWEGLTLNLVFSADHSTFTGTVVAIEQSGSGITANTTTINFNISGM